MRVLITGGAGFIGTNVAASMARQGAEVRVLDNLSRLGVRENAAWLRDSFPGIDFIEGDIRDAAAMQRAVAGVDRIYHLAGQVAVTSSVTDPRTDFDVNLAGTFNVLEALRIHAPQALLLFTSTNKVYGGMEEVGVALQDERYAYTHQPNGISEAQPLDFHSPYGCSKGGADQYVRDYARIYGVRTIVFRMSCIYGPHQCGNEDQGWVAHFAKQALSGGEISIYGDGKQVRDILYVDDLVRAFDLAARTEEAVGQVFNVGGSPANAISLLELIRELEGVTGREIPVHFHDWRPGDQRIYVTDVSRAGRTFGWQPTVSKQAGIRSLVDWLRTNAVRTPALISA